MYVSTEDMGWINEAGKKSEDQLFEMTRVPPSADLEPGRKLRHPNGSYASPTVLLPRSTASLAGPATATPAAAVSARSNFSGNAATNMETLTLCSSAVSHYQLGVLAAGPGLRQVLQGISFELKNTVGP